MWMLSARSRYLLCCVLTEGYWQKMNMAIIPLYIIKADSIQTVVSCRYCLSGMIAAD